MISSVFLIFNLVLTVNLDNTFFVFRVTTYSNDKNKELPLITCYAEIKCERNK